MKVAPLPGRVVVRPDDSKVTRWGENQKSGLLIVTDKQKSIHYETGKILAVADDVTGVKVGDRVLYPTYTGAKAVWDGKPCIGLDYVDLMGKVE